MAPIPVAHAKILIAFACTPRKVQETRRISTFVSALNYSLSTDPHSPLRLQEALGSAVQILYRACRDGQGFPGVLPQQDNGMTSTLTILESLGLLGPVSTDPKEIYATQKNGMRPPHLQSPTSTCPSTPQTSALSSSEEMSLGHVPHSADSTSPSDRDPPFGHSCYI